ncbi:MAG: helix-turn-helix domain-containing protein [Paludibacterium sp.]|uniref:AraC family transcriptional regulator n=1 Tax=Paludibacterium sp. TaxID=1917523 RepID=UPI0025DAF91C|nr:helix-turn-helix domain-containing protein [Paludibacterium sp.]MBV8048137.1 helix-turn-helix domain-containing protein [Paludibacterium sp.]
MLTFPMPGGIRHKTVSSRLIGNFMHMARRIGIAEAEFCRLTGITADDLEARDGRLAGDKHLRMLRLAEQTPFALSDLPPSLEAIYPHYPELAALWSVSRTPRLGVVRYVEHRGLIGEVDSVILEQTQHSIRLEYVNEAGMPRSAASALSNFVLVLNILRHLLDGAPCQVEIELQHTLDVPAVDIAQHLGVRVRFNRPANRFTCASDALDTVYRLHQPLVERHLQAQVEAARQRLSRRENFYEQVYAALQARLHMPAGASDSEQALQALCRQFDVSRWTLLRRLKQDGSTFQSLWSRLRAQEARRLLSETTMAIGDISARLGFSSQSALSRFFRANWGLSPAQFRAGHR